MGNEAIGKGLATIGLCGLGAAAMFVTGEVVIWWVLLGLVLIWM